MSPALADDRDKILGVWKLQTWETVFQDTGERKALYGTSPPGFVIFTPEGRMMALLTAEGRKAPLGVPVETASSQSPGAVVTSTRSPRRSPWRCSSA